MKCMILINNKLTRRRATNSYKKTNYNISKDSEKLV